MGAVEFLQKKGSIKKAVEKHWPEIKGNNGRVMPRETKEKLPSPDELVKGDNLEKEFTFKALFKKGNGDIKANKSDYESGVLNQDNLNRMAALIIGDVHSTLEPVEKILKESGLMDEQKMWVGGNRTLIFMGDYEDRGKHQAIEVLELIFKLKEQAKKKGGRVVVLVGNHDLGYISHLLANFSPIDDLYNNMNDYYQQQKNKRGEALILFWKKIKKNKSALVAYNLNDWVLVHGGVSKRFVKKFGKINTIQDFVKKINKVFWEKVDNHGHDDLSQKAKNDFSHILFRANNRNVNGSIENTIDNIAGVFWKRFRDSKPDWNDFYSLKQIVSHDVEKGKGFRRDGNNHICVDVGLSSHYGSLTNALAVVKKKEADK